MNPRRIAERRRLLKEIVHTNPFVTYPALRSELGKAGFVVDSDSTIMLDLKAQGIDRRSLRRKAETEEKPRKPATTTLRRAPPTRPTTTNVGRFRYREKPEEAILARGRPRMDHVLERDLLDHDRMQLLFRDAVARGMVKENERLLFFAAAVKVHRLDARRVRKSRVAIFLGIIKRHRWKNLSLRDKREAQRWLKEGSVYLP